MEGKKLNLNRPLLSVRTRRPSSQAVTSQKENQTKPNNSLPVPSQIPSYRSEFKTGPISNPGTVPFTWEHIPGRPKEDSKPQTQNYDKPPVAPKLPPGRYLQPNQPNSHAISRESKGETVNVDERVKNIESRKEARGLERSDSEDSDEAYVDALDTLSRAESYFINCSMSGLSGMDDLDLKPKGGFSSDIKTREFMMERFLPAAKAMVSETPHNVPKKQPVREEKRVKEMENQVYKPSLHYGPSYTNRYSHYVSDEEEESDDDYAQSGSLPGVCGLLPRFCFKSSVYLLNPVPDMSVRSRVKMSPASKIRPVSSSSGSYSTTENEVDKIRAAEFEDKTSLRNERGQSQNASPYCDVPPQSFMEGKEVLWNPEKRKHSGNSSFGSDGKGFKTFQEFLADPEELDSEDVVFEKTMYVDTIHKVESPKSRSCSSNVQETKSTGEDERDIITKRMDQMHIKDSSLEDLKKIDIVEGEEKLVANAQEFGEFNIPSSIGKSSEKWGMEMQRGFREDEDINFASTVTENIRDTNGSLGRRKLAEFLVPPPLPKSPPDSWLGRTLPSISTKNRSYYGASTNPQSQFSKSSMGNFKWETIVKSTNLQRQHLRYSEEVLAPIQET